jgi:hypothetical protein
MIFPVAVVISNYGNKYPSYTIGMDMIALSFCVTVVPALMGYYLAKWEPEDELEAESWRKRK